MNKSVLHRKLIWLIYIAITVSLVVFNVAKVYQIQALEPDVEAAHLKLEAKQKTRDEAREAQMDLFWAKSERSSAERNVVSFLGTRKSRQLDATKLLSDEVSTIVLPDDEFRWHGIKIFTNEQDSLAVRLVVSHRKLKPKSNRGTPTGGKLIGKYDFVFDVRPNVWNKFGFPLTSHGEFKTPVTSQIDGKSKIEAELPTWKGMGQSSGGSNIHIGKLEVDGQAAWVEERPFKTIYLKSTDPDATEYLELDLMIYKSNAETIENNDSKSD